MHLEVFGDNLLHQWSNVPIISNNYPCSSVVLTRHFTIARHFSLDHFERYLATTRIFLVHLFKKLLATAKHFLVHFLEKHWKSIGIFHFIF
jgi:hypothetical protein